MSMSLSWYIGSGLGSGPGSGLGPGNKLGSGLGSGRVFAEQKEAFCGRLANQDSLSKKGARNDAPHIWKDSSLGLKGIVAIDTPQVLKIDS